MVRACDEKIVARFGVLMAIFEKIRPKIGQKRPIFCCIFPAFLENGQKMAFSDVKNGIVSQCLKLLRLYFTLRFW